MAKARTKKKKSTSKAAKKDIVQVNFEGTESRGGKKRTGRAHYPEGDYAVKIVDAEQTKSPEKETKQIVVQYAIKEPKKLKGKTVYDRHNLLPQSLWTFRNMLEAAGVKVPNKLAKIKLSSLKGKELAITLEDDEYGDKLRSRVTDWFALSEYEEMETEADLDEDEDEEEEEEDEDEEDEDEDEEDEDEEDEDMEELDLDEV